MISKLAIGLTDKCSAACDMCCFACSPQGKMHLETDLLKDVIKQAGELKGVNAIGFSGGECMLYYDQLRECCEYAKSLGLRLTVNTNGFWGKNEARAREMVKGLKAAGVELISFSADRHHQEYVPIEDLRTAMRVTAQEGLIVDISIMETSESDDIVKMTEALRPEIYTATISSHPLLPIGKALETVDPDHIVRYFETAEAKCNFGGMIQLNFDGCYYLCCSQFCREIPGLNLGKATEIRLKDLEQRVTSDDFLYVMLRNGLTWYISLAREMGFEIPNYLCSPCHCCYFVFRSKEFMNAIRDKVAKEAGRLRVEHLLSLSAK